MDGTGRWPGYVVEYWLPTRRLEPAVIERG
jgi:hypothetical protein